MQTPPKSTSESQTVECPKLERPSLKSNRSVVFSEQQEPTPASALASSSITYYDFTSAVASDLTEYFSELLLEVLTTRCTSPPALLAVFDELNAMPHVPIKSPSNPCECQIRYMILLDKLFETTQKAHDKSRDVWERSPWERHQDYKRREPRVKKVTLKL